MFLPALLAVTLYQGTQPQTPAAPAFSSAFTVAEPNRLAITPKLDGILSDEEWDPLSSDAATKSYFEWEPGKLHVAASVPSGSDLIVSFDFDNNGWLVGRDNLEVRLSSQGGKAAMSARVLDATNVSGPRWIDIPGFALASSAAIGADGTNTVYEASFSDPGLVVLSTSEGSKISLRFDAAPSTTPPTEAVAPRVLTPVSLVTYRAAAVPTGLRWAPESTGRVVLPGDETRIRLTFNGDDKLGLKKIDLRSEGLARDMTSEMILPFPDFDKKGRSYVDYPTLVRKEADLGYRVLRGTLTAGDNVNSILETSYRIAPLTDIDLVHERIPTSAKLVERRLAFYVDSNSPGRLAGTVTVELPAPMRLLSGGTQQFRIMEPRGKTRMVFSAEVLPNTVGTFPIKFTTDMGGARVQTTEFVTIG